MEFKIVFPGKIKVQTPFSKRKESGAAHLTPVYKSLGLDLSDLRDVPQTR